MTERQASGTAYGVALTRLAHQLIDGEPPILSDPAVQQLFGADAARQIREQIELFQSPSARGLRSHVVLRSRFAEDALHDAVAHGVEQYVVLGAGFDTFAYRQPEWARGIRVVEADHPASQTVKRAWVARAAMAVPDNLTFADVDFEHETLGDGLRRCGVSFDHRAFFSWLGVTMYLTREAVEATLRTIAAFPKGSEVVLTFAQPAEPDDTAARELAARAAELGEPWLSYFTPAEIEATLRACGFGDVQLPTRDEIMLRYYAGRRDGLLPPRRISIARAIV